MKNFTLPLLALGLFSAAQAQNVIITKNKMSALAACEQKASYSPEKSKAEMLATCRCVVENTDFAKAIQLEKRKDYIKLQKFYQKVDDACWSKKRKN